MLNLSRFRVLVSAATLVVGTAALVACDDDPPPRYPPPPPPPGAVVVDDDANVNDTDPSALTVFHEPLDPYGTWVDDPTYGMIWVPSQTVVGDDFTPYVSSGHWIYNDEWIWVSDYEWGWVPFHYGRWVWIDGHRWCWIPGRRYSGAWVVWRGGDDGFGYVGWAPAGPEFVWRGGVAVRSGFVVAEPRYVFVERGEVFSPGLRERVIVGERARAFEGRSAAIGFSVHGPPPVRLGIDPHVVVHGARPHYYHGVHNSGPMYRGGGHGGGHR